MDHSILDHFITTINIFSLGMSKLEVMEQVVRDYSIKLDDASNQQQSIQPDKPTLISSLLAKYSKASKPAATSLEDELNRFSNISNADENVMQFWANNDKEFPKLAKIAKVLLSIPMTSAKSESAFSTAGCLIRKDRASITPYRIERTLFVHDNYDLLKL